MVRNMRTPVPASLSALRSFRRFELKFVVPEAVAAGFREALRPWTVGDVVSDEYGIESVYYDTSDLRCYWEKIDGIRLRRKVRIRRYLDGPTRPDSPVFLEIKQRLDRITQKRREPMELPSAMAFCDDGQRPPGADNEALIDEVAVLFAGESFRPTVVTGYRRSAVVGGDVDPGLRITFDRDLYFRSIEPRLDIEGRDGDLLPPGWVIIEVKVNDRLPSWLSGLIAEHDLSITRISKYVQAIERAGLAPTSAFHCRPQAIYGETSPSSNPTTSTAELPDTASSHT